MTKFLVFSLLITNIAFSASVIPVGNPTNKNLSVMFYNMTNLFDNLHDDGKNDWQFLPKSNPLKAQKCEETSTTDYYKNNCKRTDYTEEKYQLKVKQMAKAIRSARNGDLPDVIGLAEVENENAIGKLASETGFSEYIVTNTISEKRGIDVGLMFNQNKDLKYIDSQQYAIDGGILSGHSIRNLLQVHLKWKKQDLFVFVNHWPSQGHETSFRMAVAEQVKTIVDQVALENPDAQILLMGDFNTLDKETPNPFDVFSQGENTFTDIHRSFMNDSSISAKAKSSMSKGTYFFPKNYSWNVLDHFFVNKKLSDQSGLDVVLSSYRIVVNNETCKTVMFKYVTKSNYENSLFAVEPTEPKGIPVCVPKGYNFSTTELEKLGNSDHFAIYIELAIKDKKQTR